MVNYRFFFVGKRARDPVIDAIDQYLDRLSRYAKVTVHRIKDSTPRAEGAELLSHLGAVDLLIALDEAGTAISTRKLIQRVSLWQQESRTVVWAVGGADGLDASVKQRAQESWSLSAMTLSHRLAQVILIEQLYRSHTHLRGEPYHRGRR